MGQSQDSELLPDFHLDDFNRASIQSYRERLALRNPGNPWIELETKEFLYRLGAWGKVRGKSVEGPTLAGLLMFGKYPSIVEAVPAYFLDYREAVAPQPGERWSQRLVSNDTRTTNLYEFFFAVVQKLTTGIKESLTIDGMGQQDDGLIHRALREALVNTLVHADYYGEQGIVIQKEQMTFRFANPGRLGIPLAQAVRGGTSERRNPRLYDLFRCIGIGERPGSGVKNIYWVWQEQQWREPELVEQVHPDRTVLTLHQVSLFPELRMNSNLHVLPVEGTTSAVLSLDQEPELWRIASGIQEEEWANQQKLEATIVELCQQRALSLPELAVLLGQSPKEMRHVALAKLLEEKKLRFSFGGSASQPRLVYRALEKE
ncbi:ATP-dependent DNA helicase recG-like protein [Heliophilum fasciatum]|uniref:ATP-dependent DNA helicase recG-like protein n=2 Tax=Heliophilum fasciatum TaxID=35700 RepID=A0A4R2SAZ5_9FIRM|nr:ATP-dependent DNA helicase recG-like protein [Heliophilum fasciatum]